MLIGKSNEMHLFYHCLEIYEDTYHLFGITVILNYNAFKRNLKKKKTIFNI